jgi:hypothetical protein
MFPSNKSSQKASVKIELALQQRNSIPQQQQQQQQHRYY